MATGGSSISEEISRTMFKCKRIHWEVKSGDLHEVKELVRFGADLGATDSNGYTPLIQAVVSGKKIIAAFLAKKMTVQELNMVNDDGDNVLHMMALYHCPWSQVIQDIADTCPSLLQQEDRYRRRPIDIARKELTRIQGVYDSLHTARRLLPESQAIYHSFAQKKLFKQALMIFRQRTHDLADPCPSLLQQEDSDEDRPIDTARNISQCVYDTLVICEERQQRIHQQQQQHYTRGIAENMENPCNITITVVGHQGVGKSCFVRQLKQEYIPEGGPGSTDTADLYVNFFEYNPNTGLRQKLDEDGEIKTSRQRLKRIIDQQDKTYTKPSAITPQQINDSAAAVSTMEPSVSSAGKKTEESQIVEISHRNPSRSEELSDEQRHVIEEVMGTEMEDWNAFGLKGRVTIYDFGGEKVFYNTQHCFMSSNMVFVLLFDVAMCLDPRRAKDGYEQIEFWLKVFATYAIDEAAQSEGTPPVILVGSHLDLVSSDKEKQEELFISVLEKLYEKPEICEILDAHVQEMFSVANLNDCNKNQHMYKEIWNKIIEIAKLQSQWEKPVPARWVALEYELFRLKKRGNIILTYDKLLEINRKTAVPLPEHDIMNFLRRLRFTGSFLCFDLHSKKPFIVLQPQWIIDALKAIITDPKFTADLSPKQQLQWKQYDKSGVLSRALTRQLWGRHKKYRFLDEEEKLVIAMENLGLLTRPISVDAVVDYFIVPSILQTADPEIIHPVLDDPDTVTTVTICIKFDNPFIPQAIWDKMIASCIHRFQRLREFGHDGLTFIQRGFACLSVDFLWNMIINCSDNAMKVTMFKKDTDDSVPTGTGINLLKVLEFLLQRILDLNHQSHLGYKFYLHNDFRFTAEEKMVTADDLRQTPRLQCYSSNGTRWIDSNDLHIWFRNPNQKKTPIHTRYLDITKDIPDRKLSFKEIGRISRYIGSTYQTFFAELDCPVALVEQEMEEHRHLTFRSRITKIFVHLLKTEANTGFLAIADAMSQHGMDPTILINILDSNRNMTFTGETLSNGWLNTYLSINDVPIIAGYIDTKSYFNLFLELGFTPRTVDDFDDEYRNKRTLKKITALLVAFINETDPRPTVNTILLAMRECDMDTEYLIRALNPT